jgi:hypothetical protein|tara:strand:- start:3091 stop:4296 length:1206 start_codon:yes stop_codon:yes gene_type:complete
MLGLSLFLVGGSRALTVEPSGAATIDVLGAVAQEIKCCGKAGKDCPGHVPDIPARVFVQRGAAAADDHSFRVNMVVGSTTYYPMHGPSPLVQNRSCTISYNKTADSNPADFAGNEYLDSPYSFGNGTVVSLVHTEFPGNKYNLSCAAGTYPLCWSVSIGLAISHDWGATFAHPAHYPPPHHLVAAVPYQNNESQLASGWGDPSNILKHPTDGYFYALIWNRHQVGLQAPGICMMRTKHLLDPTSWRAFDGSDYSRTFVDAYTSTDDPAKHVCVVTNLPAGSVEDGCAAHGLFYSTYLKKFVTTLGCDQGKTPTFLYSISDDLVHWSKAETLMNQTIAREQSKDLIRGMNYPTFIDHTAPSAFGDDNFYTIGQNPHLYWVSIGDNPEDIGRHLLATPFTFQK